MEVLSNITKATRFIVIHISDVYDGPFAKGLTRKTLQSESGFKVKWYEGPNKMLDAKVGDIISGVCIIKEGKYTGCINYRESSPVFHPNKIKRL